MKVIRHNFNEIVMIKEEMYAFLLAVIVLCSGTTFTLAKAKEKPELVQEFKLEAIKLPKPTYDSNTSVEEALLKRRSVRSYKDSSLTLAEVSQLFWAAQGVTSPRDLRTAPSAGALYPLEVYVVAGNVDDLPDGVYRYRPHMHELERVVEGDRRLELCNAALRQTSVRNAAAVIVLSAVYERTTVKYGDRGIRYVHIEAGHAAQNVFLQAVPLNIGTVVIGAFDDQSVKKVLNMSDKEQPLYIMPVGRMK
jgi:SagB-type dehydrogenase family enzyme